jgi:hypothetical protein
VNEQHGVFVLASNKAKMRMSEYPEEIPGQIAAGINRLGSRGYTLYSIYPIGADVPYDEFPYPAQWIQATGIAPDRLTVEIKQRDGAGIHRLHAIGHQEASAETAETEIIYNGDNEYRVRPAEVLTATEAIGLFQHYYETHSIPAGWHLREHLGLKSQAAEEGIAAKGRAIVAEITPAPHLNE